MLRVLRPHAVVKHLRRDGLLATSFCSSGRSVPDFSGPRNVRPSKSFSTTVTRLEAQPEKPYYVTTPIFYVNAAPHVGHLYSMVLADIIKKWQELKGRRAILCTGTDEHGMKVQRAAVAANTEPKAFCDQGSEVFKSLAAEADVDNDHFVRTTDTEHREAVQYAWSLLEERGYIYLSKHEGWYSVSDETFYPQSGVHLIVEPSTGRKIMTSIETGKEVEWLSETNYKFRLSAFRNQLLSFYARNPTFVQPVSRMKDVVRSVEMGVEDLSVSRPSQRLSWGIPVPKDKSQTIYVWLDALINYITKAGYPWAPGTESSGGWPADLQIIGKDIVRFHCIYWPAFLMALEIPPPRQILTHAHWTLGREKMAKSTGNVVNPFFALKRFGVDVMRFYLAHDGGISQDSDYSNEFIIERYMKALQGGLGNLASRVVRGKGWDVHHCVRNRLRRELRPDDKDRAVLTAHGALMRQTSEQFAAKMDDNNVGEAIKTVLHLIYKTNAFMQSMEPWTTVKQLRKEDGSADAYKQGRAKVDRVIFQAAESLRISAIMLLPVMPSKMGHLLDMLGVAFNKRNFAHAHYCSDETYGEPIVDVGKGHLGVLFPPLAAES